MSAADTIAAVATAPGPGGIGIVRLSGARAGTIGEALSRTRFRPRYAHYCSFYDDSGHRLDSGLALYFPAPHSFTGEHVVELQAHGGPVILDLLLQACCQLGARPAQPGEFSQRAFLNDKIDLTQAEAIADLIASTTTQAALNASRSLQGAFSRRVDELVDAVTELRVYIEAAIDFPDEEVDFLAEGKVADRLTRIEQGFDAVSAEARQGSLLREGMKLVIAGKPNAGKSSLLNALSGQDSAIVTPVEGTTRDVLREQIQIDGMPVHIVDTAGLRDGGDSIEREGMRRAWREIDSADHILLVVDGTSTATGPVAMADLWPQRDTSLAPGTPVTVVYNKCDLSEQSPRLADDTSPPTIHLSAKTGAGMDLLRQHLKDCVNFQADAEGGFSARRRHLEALARAQQHLLHGQQQLLSAGAGELLAEDLRQCQNALGEITGAVSSDDLLGEIFSSFCIGK